MSATAIRDISIIGVQGLTSISENNFSDSAQTLENALEPGTPVMFENYEKGHHIAYREKTERYFFISNGTLDPKGTFGIEKGKRNFIYAQSNESSSDFRLVRNVQGQRLENHKLSIPSSWRVNRQSSGSFSPEGPAHWTEAKSGGTNRIMVGDSVEKKFFDIVDSLRFSRDAVYFRLDGFYASPGESVIQIGDSVANLSRQQYKRNKPARDLTLITASGSLIRSALRNDSQFLGSLNFNQLGWYSVGVGSLREKGFPVDSRDYLVRELQHPQRNIAFVKVGQGFFLGEAYILPFSDEMDEAVEYAFSPGHVKKYYPAGFRE